MAEKVTMSKYFPVIVIAVTMLLLLLCCGEFVRIEIALKEQYSRIQHLETVVSSITTIKIPRKRSKEAEKPFHSWVEKALEDTRTYRTKRNLNINDQINSKDDISKLGNNERKLVEIIRSEFNRALFNFFERKYSILIPGPPGPPGKTGLTGPRGRPGPIGQKGSRGETGAQGPMGDPGMKGQQGMRGTPGLKGDPGEDGTIGLQGPQGMPGPKGERGQSLEAPSLVVSPPYLVVNESESAIFQCSASGFPRPDVIWSKVGDSLPVKRATADVSGELKIEHVKMSDIGKYKCMARNVLGKAEQFTKLEVNCRPKIALEKGPIYVAIGTNITLPKCQATGYPKPKVTWSKFAGQLKPYHRTTHHGDLSLLEVNENDSGRYLCTAQNSLGSVVAGCELVVVGLPVLINKPDSSYYVQQGTNLRLMCSARGNPKPVITWRKEKGALNSARHELKLAGSLVLKNIQSSGIFVCVATSAGLSKVEAKTKVQLIYQDCSEIYKSGVRQNGVYSVSPDGKGLFQVYCDMTTDGGGWTVFQRRQDGSVDFYRNWQQYKTGFGNLTGEFWLGNDYIHQLTAKTGTTLRVELGDWGGITVHAKYGSFSIADESNQYRLRVASYSWSGTAGDSLSQHNNMAFTTKDRDNDADKNQNLAVTYIGAWWYYDDYSSSLNGKYSRNAANWQGINWVNFKWGQTLKYTEMKVRPQSF